MSPAAKHEAMLRRDLHRIRSFVRVAETGSINRAARSLGVAQPALSRCLRELERSLGRQLLQRSGRGCSLTLDGQRVYEAGRRMEEALRCAESEYRQLLGQPVRAAMGCAVPLGSSNSLSIAGQA